METGTRIKWDYCLPGTALKGNLYRGALNAAMLLNSYCRFYRSKSSTTKQYLIAMSSYYNIMHAIKEATSIQAPRRCATLIQRLRYLENEHQNSKYHNSEPRLQQKEMSDLR